MISKEIFQQGMGTLGASYGREVGGGTAKVYFAALAPHLTDVQFIDAVNKAIVSERFWPSPAVLLEKAGADADALALRAWDAMRDTVQLHGGYRFLPVEVFGTFDAPTKAGIRAVGGLAEIAGTTQERWPALVRRFCKAYQEALSPRPALASPPTDPRVKRLVAETGRVLALPPRDR